MELQELLATPIQYILIFYGWANKAPSERNIHSFVIRGRHSSSIGATCISSFTWNRRIRIFFWFI